MKKREKKRLLVIFLCIVTFLVAISVWYVNDYYRSDENVQQYFKENTVVTIEKIDDGLWLNGPGEEDALIFYPGAKVEYIAYIPLMYQLAENGMDVFLVEMPCNLAFLGMNKADDIIENYEYNQWYLGGHSLGGAMAASYSAKNLNKLSGLVLLASYPTESLQTDGFSVISIYGSEDGVLNMEKVEEGRTFMPEDYTEICIDGGNHAQFGNYGVQDKDGVAIITGEEQQKQTIEAILKFIIHNPM